jgi:Zn finger protein HypA/HybF involved in hydrogenase expression
MIYSDKSPIVVYCIKCGSPKILKDEKTKCKCGSEEFRIPEYPQVVIKEK